MLGFSPGSSPFLWGAKRRNCGQLWLDRQSESREIRTPSVNNLLSTLSSSFLTIREHTYSWYALSGQHTCSMLLFSIQSHLWLMQFVPSSKAYMANSHWTKPCTVAGERINSTTVFNKGRVQKAKNAKNERNQPGLPSVGTTLGIKLS